MRKVFLMMICLMGFSVMNSQVYYQAAPEGFGAAATGGGNAAPVTVTDFTSLRSNITSAGSKVILVSGTIQIPSGQQISAVITNKSIIGLPGAKLVNENQTGAGILNLKNGSNNVIIRNLIFVGPGAYDINGNDNLTNQGGTNIWVDHCEFQDGQDGNFDNVGSADNVTISWCKFTYLKAPIAGGVGGSNDHRFSNLVGSSATDSPADGHYSITYQSCYWADGCRERMPRARNAELHILNCYYNTNVSGAVGLGLGGGTKNSTVYVENTNYAKISTFFKSYVSTDGGSIAVNYINSLSGAGAIGGGSNIGTVSPPNYAYTVIPTENVAAYVPDPGCGAGATLQVTESGVITPGQCANMGVGSTGKTPELKLFPVPVKDVLNIELPVNQNRLMNLEIYTPEGRKVYSGSVPNTSGKTMTVDVAHFPKGTYFGRLRAGEQSFPLKFIKD
ncbi:MAG: T9SS type A sorting domain-containing protein [Weeksellaceae bacterium]|nr:T9SS type A sorting domain-containing protein [Bacteroidota bacterium]MCG2780661.1 T9SS type A sorting domain-containing protein [Weeksellaceae bacterium]